MSTNKPLKAVDPDVGLDDFCSNMGRKLGAMQALLVVAKCPHCDGSGEIPVLGPGHDGEEDVVFKPCYWHKKRKEVLE